MCAHMKKIFKDLMGEFKEEYAALYDYAQAIVDTNPGSTCFAKSSNENLKGKSLFIRFYTCLVACKKGWVEGCRKIIGLDGFFLKDCVNDRIYVLWGGMETTKCFL